MFGEDQIALQLADVRAALQDAVSSPESAQVELVTSEAAEGRLKVTVGTDGRIDQVDLEPRPLTEGSGYLAERFKTAVNDALDRRAEAMGSEGQVPDLRAINESVAEVQDRSLRQFKAMSASISETTAKL